MRHACRLTPKGIPLSARILGGMGAALAVRWHAWQLLVDGEDLVRPMGPNADANYAWAKATLRALLGASDSCDTRDS